MTFAYLKGGLNIKAEAEALAVSSRCCEFIVGGDNYN